MELRIRPIEEAPKDGTIILAWQEGVMWPPMACHWTKFPDRKGGHWQEFEAEIRGEMDPTHWIECPYPMGIKARAS